MSAPGPKKEAAPDPELHPDVVAWVTEFVDGDEDDVFLPSEKMIHAGTQLLFKLKDDPDAFLHAHASIESVAESAEAAGSRTGATALRDDIIGLEWVKKAKSAAMVALHDREAVLASAEAFRKFTDRARTGAPMAGEKPPKGAVPLDSLHFPKRL